MSLLSTVIPSSYRPLSVKLLPCARKMSTYVGTDSRIAAKNSNSKSSCDCSDRAARVTVLGGWETGSGLRLLELAMVCPARCRRGRSTNVRILPATSIGVYPDGKLSAKRGFRKKCTSKQFAADRDLCDTATGSIGSEA